MLAKLRGAGAPPRYLAWAVVCLFVGCGPITIPASSSPLYVAPRTPDSIAVWVAGFEFATGVTVTHPVLLATSPEFAALGATDTTLGLCLDFVAGVGGSTALLRVDFWLTAPDTMRWVVLTHELGHCTLGRDHLSEVASDGCEASLMAPWVDGPVACLRDGRREPLDYLVELVGPSSPTSGGP